MAPATAQWLGVLHFSAVMILRNRNAPRNAANAPSRKPKTEAKIKPNTERPADVPDCGSNMSLIQMAALMKKHPTIQAER